MWQYDFRATNGWLNTFKKRFGICLLTIMGEKLSCDISAVDPFVRKFPERIRSRPRAGESSLFWRLLPTKNVVHQAEESTPSHKMSKDRITFMPCSNASSNHKLEMLVIGKVAKPGAFKNQSLPVIYKSQGHIWVIREVFTERFHESFEPSVKTFLKKQNLPSKALLNLDNAPGHPSEEQLKSRDG
jgi:hypothetical protein